MTISAETVAVPVETAAAGSGAVGLSLSVRRIDGPQWDRLIVSFDDACQEQLHVFAQHRWPGVDTEPLVFEHAGRIVGGALVMVQHLPLRLGAIAVTKWGPLLADRSASDSAAIYAGMIDCLVAEYAQRRGLMLSVLPRASLSARNDEYEHLIARGFRKSSVLGFPNRYIVKLRLSDQEQRKSFAQKWRYHLNKSEKLGLSFEHAGPERLGEFETLYQSMTNRKQFADHSAFDTLPALMAIKDDALRPELFFVRYQERVVAGAVIFKAGERAVYLYGATNDEALPLHAGYFIHWNIIRWLRDNTRAEWYDLGGTDGFQGLHQFKKGMVGSAGVIEPVPPVANYASNPLAFILGTIAFEARDTMHAGIRKLRGLFNARTRPTLERPGE